MSDLNWLRTFHGFLFVDKPEGITSQDVITRLQHALIARSGGKLKKRELPAMGHGGTLDPFATGLLVVAVGDGVKLTRYLLGSDKSYAADVAFGARTASGDLTNEVTERTDHRPRELESLRQIAASFLGEPYLQIPPMYSAKKIEGVPLYELARKGLSVERAAVACTVRKFEVLGVTPDPSRTRAVSVNGDFSESGPLPIASVRIKTTVTAGTFIRTLAEDFAVRAGSLAHLTSLRRLASGSLSLDAALSLDGLAAALAEGRAWSDLSCFIPFHRAVLGILPRMEIDLTTAEKIFAGEVRTLAQLTLSGPGSIALYAKDRLVAIVRDAEPTLGTARTIERGFPLRFRD